MSQVTPNCGTDEKNLNLLFKMKYIKDSLWSGLRHFCFYSELLKKNEYEKNVERLYLWFWNLEFLHMKNLRIRDLNE